MVKALRIFVNEEIYQRGRINITPNDLQIGGRFNAANVLLAAVFSV